MARWSRSDCRPTRSSVFRWSNTCAPFSSGGRAGTCSKARSSFPAPSPSIIGMLSYPFHLYVEALGAVVEFVGYALLPVAFMMNTALPRLYIPFLVLGLAYATFLSVGSVVLEELTQRRYPSFRDLKTLLLYALLENFGYRQVVLWFRFQGVIRFLAGFHKWEKVVHVGTTSTAQPTTAIKA